jgi:hypothetical protein
LQILITNQTTTKDRWEWWTTNSMTTTDMTPEEMERNEFEFQIALLLEEEREFNRQKMRQTGDYHKIGAGVAI